MPPRVCPIPQTGITGLPLQVTEQMVYTETALLVKGLGSKEMSWCEPLLELTQGGVAGCKAAEHGLGVEKVGSDCRACEARGRERIDPR